MTGEYVYAFSGFNREIKHLLMQDNYDVERVQGKYHEIYRFQTSLYDKLYDKFKKEGNPLLDYLNDLIHESRASGSIVINTLNNLKFYRREHPENVQGMEHTIYHHFLLFYIGVQSLEILHNIIFKNRKEK